MNRRDLETLFAYNRWANHRLLGDAALLSPAEFTRDLSSSHASIRGTFVHILWAEWLWVHRWRGESPTAVFTAEDYPDVEALATRWAEVEAQQTAFIEQLTPGRLDDRIAYRNLKNERWEYELGSMMQHTVNHSTYHRGQIAAFLRQLGRVPSATDFLVYFDEGGSG